MSIHDYFAGSTVDLKGLSKYLDGLDNASRIAEARSLSGREQARLFDAANGFKPLTLKDFVPEGHPPLQQVRHYGRNSLPFFTIFEKRFCRPDTSDAGNVLWGYNHSGPIVGTFVGPGYFVAKQANDKEVVVDYFDVPPRKPEVWPRILPNSARLSRFVFFHTRDYIRGVSSHVTIGRATRDGKVMNNWFILCREE